MADSSLQEITNQLESSSLRDRMVALASLRDIPAEDAVPLIKKVLDDESLQLQRFIIKYFFN